MSEQNGKTSMRSHAEADFAQGENPAPPVLDDHLFTPPVDAPWERCVMCNLASAAHTRGDFYQPTAPRAKPEREDSSEHQNAD
jgi:hypothetical protein